MADNDQQDSQVKHNRDVSPGRETAAATESADDEARETMNQGSDANPQPAEGTADHGRDPEYYAENQRSE